MLHSENVLSGYIIPFQQNPLQNQVEGLENVSVDSEVEMPSEIPKFESGQGNGEPEAPVAHDIQAEEESETKKVLEYVVREHLSNEKVSKEHDAEGSSANPDDHYLTEKVTKLELPAGKDEKDAETSVSENDRINVIAVEQATEATVAPVEENSAAHSAEHAEPRSTSEEGTTTELSAPIVVESGKGKMDESKESDENTSTENVQIGECEKTETIPASPENEKLVLEESIASVTVSTHEEDQKLEHATAFSKPDACAIEEATDPADAVNEKSCDSEPPSEDQFCQASMGTKEDSLKKSNYSPIADDADKITASEISVGDAEEIMEPTLETTELKIVDGATDVMEVAKEQHDTSVVPKEEMEEETVQYDIKTETSLGAGEEKCALGEDLQTNGAPKLEMEVSGSVEYTSQAEEEVDVQSHTETIKTEMQEEAGETIEKDISEAEVPELSTEYEDFNNQTTSEEVGTSLEREEHYEKNAEANYFTKGKFSSEEVHDVENLTRDYTVDVTEQHKTDQQKVLEGDSSENKNIQTDESGCEKAIDEALNTESFQEGPETEKIILEETTAYKSPEKALEEVIRPENVQDDSKQSSYTIEEVADSVHREISSISEPASEIQNCEEVSGTKQETLHRPDTSPVSDDVSKSASQECLPSETNGTEAKEEMQTQSQTIFHETVVDTEDATELKEDDDTGKDRAEKFLKEDNVQRDGALKTFVAVNDCIDTEEHPHLEEEVNIHSHEITKPEIQEKDEETMQEVSSETHELPSEFKDVHTETTGVNDSQEDKFFSEEVNEGEGKTCERGLEEEGVQRDGAPDTVVEVNDGMEEVSHLDEEVNIHRKETIRLEVKEKKVASETDVCELSTELEGVHAQTTCNEVTASSESKKQPERTMGGDDSEEGKVSSEEVKEGEGKTCESSLEKDDVQRDGAPASETKTHELPSELEGVHTLATSYEVTASTGPEKLCEKTTGVNDSVEEKCYSKEVNEGEVKTCESSLEEDDEQSDGAPKRVVEVNDGKEELQHLEDEVNIHRQETIKPEIQEKDGETTQEVTSETEVHELSTELDGIHTQTTYNEATASTAPEKQCEETAEVNHSVEEKVSYEEVGEEKGKACESSLEEAINEVTLLKEIHLPSPVECSTIGDMDTCPGLDCTQAEVETLPAEEIQPESGNCETTKEETEKEGWLQEEITVSIPQTEDTREESSSNLMSQQTAIEQHNEEKAEAATIQQLDDEHEESKGHPKDSYHSIRPEIEETDAVEATTNTREIEVVPKEVDVFDSQITESVSIEETNSGESRELEVQVFTPVPTTITENGENGTAAEVEKISEENKTGTYMTLQNETLELSSTVESTTERLQEEAADSIPQTKNGREESSSDLTSQQCIPMAHDAEEEEPAAVLDRHDGHEKIKGVPEEAGHSIRPETEVTDAVEEEKSEVIGTQLTESVANEEINSSKSREMEMQVLSPLPTAIHEKTGEEEEAGGEVVQKQNETLELSSSAELTKERLQKEAIVSIESIPQTEDAAEKDEETITEQHTTEKDEAAAVQDRKDPEEALYSIHPDTEITDAVDATFEEEKSEVTMNNIEIGGISRELDVSVSQLTESVAEEKISVDQLRELQIQFPSQVPTVISESIESETVEMAEKTGEENKTDAEMIQQKDTLELSSTANGDRKANESMPDFPNETNKGLVNTGEDSKQEPLKEESNRAAGIDYSVGEERIVTSSLTDPYLERTGVAQETSPEFEVQEEPSGLENPESLNLNVEEADADAEKQCEDTIEAKDTDQSEVPNDEAHPGDKDVNASDSTKEVPKNYGAPEVVQWGELAVASAVVEDEETNEKNEDVSGSSNELSIKEEAQEGHGFDSIEQTGALVGIIADESIKEAGIREIKDPGSSSIEEVKKEESVEKVEKTEDVVQPANEAAETTQHRSSPVEALQVDPLEKDSKMEHAESLVTSDKSSEVIVETEMISDLTSQRSEVTEKVEVESHIKGRTLGSKDSETRSLICKGETVEAGEEYQDAGGEHDIIHEDISNKKNEEECGKAQEGARNELENVPCEISTANFEAREDSSIVLAEYSLEKEATPTIKSAPTSIAADRNIDDEKKIVSDEQADDVEEHLQEKIFEEAETPCEESSAASLPTQETKINLWKTEQDDAIEQDQLGQKHDAIEKADDQCTNIKEEINTKGGTAEEIQAEYQERDSTLAEDITAKNLNEQMQEESFEPEAHAASKSEPPIMDILESDQTKGEQLIASTEEMEKVKNIEKEISEEADAGGENIGAVVPVMTDMSILANELEKTTKKVELQHNKVLLSTTTGASEATSKDVTEDISINAAESVSDDMIHEVTCQLEDIEIKEAHFSLTPMDSAVGELNEKLIEADGILPDKPSREEKEETIHYDKDKLKGEEVMKEKTETLKSTIGELQFQEIAKECAINETRARNESGEKFSGRQETEEISLPGEPTTEECQWKDEKKLQKVEAPSIHNDFLEINEEIKQEARMSSTTPEGDKKTNIVIPTFKEDVSLKIEETAGRTFQKPQESDLEHGNPPPGHGEEKVDYTMGEKECKEPDLIKTPSIEKLQVLIHTTETKDPIERSLPARAEEAEMAKADETKTDKEYGGNEANEDEQAKFISEHDTPVMVEPSKDNDGKANHKKSHNILSGVGSKVKNSISKVKKAITGKSSHSKTPPKQSL
ncbi:hypothetical protein SAY86_001839 [Trapa natans]|uniref:Uncharacterized protein n=1 Tax=Trapa natans TaxID=22666 RepID=A0AAN7R1X6_TRANT|nr:hypothetical protein SAY86_001839 [Trapa natans]